ncbi:MAG: SGNH/GDSL hydrolase family protein [Candidatus Symbiothrix sp.]|jgi:lysophospholipase L1-like esterase|nr:SGNH/GDSL hydrolase family protein [Candidatus Symbiothrix sp.]
MKKIQLFFLCTALGWPVFAQQNTDSLTLTVGGETYKQLEKHFRDKQQKEKQESDWACFGCYAAANDTVKAPVEAVFLGNSITWGWYRDHPEFFNDNGFVGRGVSGQTTGQMLVRFQADVVALKPKVVVILAGTNDIALNNGKISLENILLNFKSMCELAKINRIRPIICSVLPAYQYKWRPELRPVEDIKKLNEMLKTYAEKNSIPYIDYYAAMVDEQGGLPQNLSYDGVHPSKEGYTVMEKLAIQTLRKYVKIKKFM